jgi:signal transduction histidine kinase
MNPRHLRGTTFYEQGKPVRKSIDDKSLKLLLTGDAHELNLVGDPLRASQVLVNLLSNAV